MLKCNYFLIKLFSLIRFLYLSSIFVNSLEFIEKLSSKARELQKLLSFELNFLEFGEFLQW